MDWITGLQSSIDYMENHLTDSPDYGKIAAFMNVSVFYFHRIFTMLCGITPGEYIRRRRLALAGSELLASNVKIIDIALKYGYDTPDGFTRAFTRFHGATPTAVRQGRSAAKTFAPLQVSITMKGGTSMNYKIITKEAFKVLEKVETHSIEGGQNKNTIPQFWSRAKTDGTIDTLTSSFLDGEDKVLGICYGNSPSSSKTFEYSIAAVCGESQTAPKGFRVKEIPARTWAVFECTGAMPDAIQEMWHRIITEFFPTSDYEPTYEMDIEVYPDGDMSANNFKSWICVAVKKR